MRKILGYGENMGIWVGCEAFGRCGFSERAALAAGVRSPSFSTRLLLSLGLPQLCPSVHLPPAHTSAGTEKPPGHTPFMDPRPSGPPSCNLERTLRPTTADATFSVQMCWSVYVLGSLGDIAAK